MFAPAVVGAGMRLSAKAFEAGRSARSNSARRMAEGCRSALLSVKPEKIAQWRSDANGKMRLSPAPAGPLPLVSASFDEETSGCWGRQGLRERSQGRRGIVHGRGLHCECRGGQPQDMFAPTGHLSGGAVRLRAVRKISE
jgi:hypothetical protein